MNFFHHRHILIIKQHDIASLSKHDNNYTDLIIRDDKYENSFHYVVIDNTTSMPLQLHQLPVRRDIFKDCKERPPKERVAYMPRLPE
jgi:hypothetical protein